MFFKDQIKKRIKNEKGLTLVELLAVIVILGIIAAIAVPAIGNIIANSRAKAVISDAQNAISAANLYYTDNKEDVAVFSNDTSVAGSTDTTTGYLENAGTLDKLTVTKLDNKLYITFTTDTINGKVFEVSSGTNSNPGLSLEEINELDVKDGEIFNGTASIAKTGG